MTNFNERTNTLYKNISLTLYSRKGDVSYVREVSWRRGQTATYWPKVILTIAALNSHLGWGCSTVGHWGPQALILQADSHAGTLSPTDSNCNSNCNWPKPSVAPGYIIVLSPSASAYLHRCISWLTARSRVNI